MEIKHKLIFKDKKYEISIEFKHGIEALNKIPKEIGYKLFKNEPYKVQSNVQPEVFQSFLKYWQNSEEPDITDDNIYEYYLLSKEFCLMSEYFSEETNENKLHIASLKYLTNITANEQNAIDKAKEERYIAMNLDSYIEKNKEKMLEIPIQSLFNIFFHKDRVLENQQEAFDFIEQNKEQNSKLSILLPSLNAEKLNRKTLIDTLTKRECNFGFIPNLQQSFFDPYKSEIVQECQKVLSRVAGYLYYHDEDKILISMLYEECFDVNSIISYEDDDYKLEITPLCIAVASENIDLIKHLLEKPKIDINVKSVSINKKTEEEEYKLFPDNEEKLKFVGLDIEETSPLYLAIENKNIEIIDLLLKKPELDVNTKIIHEKKTEIESFEISSKALKLANSIIKSPESIIQSKEKLNEVIHIFAKRSERTPLDVAIKKKNAEIVNLLLKRPDIDVNVKSFKQNEFLKLEIENELLFSDSPRRKERAPLYFAIEKENIDIIKLLLEHQALDINVKSLVEKNNFTWSLLVIGIQAVIGEKMKSLEPLNKINIALNKQIIDVLEDREKKSALHLAIEKGNIEIIKLLLSNSNLDINSTEHKKCYLRCNLSESEKSEIQKKCPNVLELINDILKNIKLDEEDKEETVLHIAVKKGEIEIIKALLENKNIDVEKTDEKGKKPINLTDNQEIKSLLSTYQES